MEINTFIVAYWLSYKYAFAIFPYSIISQGLLLTKYHKLNGLKQQRCVHL